ncbi:FAD-dependent monooxygenase [Nocardioides sp. NPDC051685]|uniref:FAD-dependent monooxygenase n=1 Tax=Nocardioides sp. NPDC051685 TaxID=3364334 RepID=UPI003788931E
MNLRIACVGGGPGGLFFATLLKQAHPEADITVFERNRAEDTFGFGVVFSDATLDAINAADPVLRTALDDFGIHWEEIEVRLKGETFACGGNGMTAIVRKKLLQLLQERAIEAGVDVRFSTEAALDDLTDFDLVVAGDGANSRIREQLAAAFEPSFETATAKFIWFGTTYAFDGLTFVHVRGEHGVFAVHGYPIAPGLSTFIVETDEETWRRAGLDEFDTSQPPGTSDQKSKEYLERLFADQIDGHPLVVNNSRWANFRTRRAARWTTGNIALLGDAAHTAHFSVGSGTKMAMEDAIALAAALGQHPDDVPAALAAYEAGARPPVEKIQGSARPSLSWWEHFGRYHDTLEPWQFAFHFLSRSIGAQKIARRDPEFVAAVREEWRASRGADVLATGFELGEGTFASRRVSLAEVRRSGARLLEVDAPSNEHELADARRRLLDGLENKPDLVVLSGGSALCRALLSEDVRLGAGVPSLLVEPEASDDRVETLVLSGRADLVAEGTRDE